MACIYVMSGDYTQCTGHVHRCVYHASTRTFGTECVYQASILHMHAPYNYLEMILVLTRGASHFL